MKDVSKWNFDFGSCRNINGKVHVRPPNFDFGFSSLCFLQMDTSGGLCFDVNLNPVCVSILVLQM